MFLFCDDLWHKEEEKRKSLKTDIDVYCEICGMEFVVTGALSDWPEHCLNKMKRLHEEPQDCPI